MSFNAGIGNDIIDWKKAQNQHQKLRIRCLEKLFQAHEIEYIQSAEKPILAFWHLWSVKESAYKAWQRQQNAKPILNAKSFVCQNISPHSVLVSKGVFSYTVHTIYTSDYIYSECLSYHKQTKIFKTTDAYLRFKNNWQDKGWQIIKKANNIPSLFNAKKETFSAISLSHDNHLTAVTGYFL